MADDDGAVSGSPQRLGNSLNRLKLGEVERHGERDPRASAAGAYGSATPNKQQARRGRL